MIIIRNYKIYKEVELHKVNGQRPFVASGFKNAV